MTVGLAYGLSRVEALGLGIPLKSGDMLLVAICTVVGVLFGGVAARDGPAIPSRPCR